jgi:hypothetical protein
MIDPMIKRLIVHLLWIARVHLIVTLDHDLPPPSSNSADDALPLEHFALVVDSLGSTGDGGGLACSSFLGALDVDEVTVGGDGGHHTIEDLRFFGVKGGFGTAAVVS